MGVPLVLLQGLRLLAIHCRRVLVALVHFIFRFYVVGGEDPVLVFWILFMVPPSCCGLFVAGVFPVLPHFLLSLVCDRRTVRAKLE